MVADASEVMLHMLGIGSQLHMLCRTWAMGTSAEATTKMHMVLMRLQLKVPWYSKEHGFAIGSIRYLVKNVVPFSHHNMAVMQEVIGYHRKIGQEVPHN